MNGELLKATLNFLKKHRLPSEEIRTLSDHMRKAKRILDEKMGLSEDNLYRVEIPLIKNEDMLRRDYPLTYAVVAHLLHQAAVEGKEVDVSTISLVKNEILFRGQTGKVTKLLAQFMSGKEALVMEHCAAELGIKNIDQFMPKLGDIIKTGRKVIVSTNLLDFLSASDNAAYTSCHRVGGGSWNGNMAYARDAMTVISFISKDTDDIMAPSLYKLGRGWINVAEPHIVQCKTYGSFFNNERDGVRKFLIEKFSGGAPYTTHRGIKLSVDSFKYEKAKDNAGGAAMWYDNYGLDISSPEGVSYKGVTLNFATAICLECGCTTNHKDYGSCRDHQGKARVTCDCCGERVNADTVLLYGDDQYCRRCADEHLFRCRLCGQYHRKEEQNTVKGNAVCNTCLKNQVFICDCCGEQEFNKNSKEIDTVDGKKRVCSGCLHKYVLCSICNKYHSTETVAYYPYLGKVCHDCRDKEAFKCSSCGDYFPERYNVGGKCERCDAALSGRAVDIKKKPKYAGLPEGWEDYTEEVG